MMCIEPHEGNFGVFFGRKLQLKSEVTNRDQLKLDIQP